MLLPTSKIETQAELNAAISELMKFTQTAPTAKAREFSFTVAVLRTLGSTALDVVAQMAGSSAAQEATRTAYLRDTARRVAKSLGYEMRKTR